MNKCLVTGADGFIGQPLVKKLQSEGFEVIALSLSHGDICDPNTLKPFQHEKFQHVFHLAAVTFVPDSWQKPVRFMQINALGTQNVLEFCRKSNNSMTFISSYLYGNVTQLPIKETHPLQPNNPYALSKKVGEDICRFYAENFAVEVNVIRPFNIYGPGQNEKFLIPYIIDQALHADEIRVKDLVPKRDYIYLDDVIDALMKAMKHKKFDIYNIGSGESYSVKEVIDIVQDLTGITKKVISESQVRTNEINDTRCDNVKAKKQLEWRLSISFREGLAKMIDHFS